MSNDQWLKENIDYFRGAFEDIPADLPEGAWLESHYDTADYLITSHEKTRLFDTDPPDDLDGYDVAMYYLERKKGKI